MFVFFHYLLWKAKLNFDCLELKARLVVYQRSIRSGFHCLLWRYENPSLHYTVLLICGKYFIEDNTKQYSTVVIIYDDTLLALLTPDPCDYSRGLPVFKIKM